MTWNQTDFLDGAVNATVDPYYLCFLDDTTPTATVAGFLAPTVDFTANLASHLISGVMEPCVVSRPALIASRPGGKFLNGQRRDIPVAHPYVKGSIMIRPGTPADHQAFAQGGGHCDSGVDRAGWRLPEGHAGSLALPRGQQHRPLPAVRRVRNVDHPQEAIGTRSCPARERRDEPGDQLRGPPFRAAAVRYFLTAVRTYAGQRPIFYTSGSICMATRSTRLWISCLSPVPISFKTTVFQARADFFRVGKLTLRLNGSLPQWIPGSGWLQSDRDHLISVTTDSADVLWRGYATGVKVTKDAGAEWTFSSLYDRLDDVQIAGDDDETRAAIPAQNIMDEVAAQLPDVWPTVDASAWADVFRPDENTSARDFVAKMLTAEGEILVPDANGELEVRAIGPRQDTFNPAAGLTIKSSRPSEP